MSTGVFDDRPCALGEGPLWHPGRAQLFWFDIVGRRLMSREGARPLEWRFDERVSAAGLVDDTRLFVASETRLFVFDIETGDEEDVAPLEADRPDTRSNDGRADPMGGFWISTMGQPPRAPVGAIYRYYRGELRRIVNGLFIPNAISFAPDGRAAYYADTTLKTVWRQPLDAEGWPEGPRAVFLDLVGEGLNPDGAVTDAEGNLWLAQWGASRVAAYSPEGAFLRAVGFAAAHTSCPAFGGPDHTTLFCTSAREGLSDAEIAANPSNGMTFAAEGVAAGRPEPEVVL